MDGQLAGVYGSLRELYNRGVQLAGGARMGHTSEPDRTEPYRGILSRKAQKIPQGKVGHRQPERHRQIRRQRQ
ncbi:MAG: hypothetical protein ACLR7F_04930 [Waltera sp.]